MPLDRRTVLRAAAGGALAVGGALGAATAGGRFLVGDGPVPPAVLVAGSLQGVARRVGDASVEAHGSVAVRRLVLEGARDPDAVAVADPRLLDGVAERGRLFATNALVLAYDPASPAAGAIRSDWTAAVEDPSLALGRTDPRQDPLGYRTVLALRLAEPLGVDAEAVLAGSSVFPETALLRALEAGQLDAAFAYRSMAVEHDLPYVSLPPSIDFADPDRADHYATASMSVDGETVTGAPIVYAAAALTPRGEPWVAALSTARPVLEDAGFAVPAGYPTSVDVTALEPWGA